MPGPRRDRPPAPRFMPDIALVGMNTLNSCSRRSISSSAFIAAGTKTPSAAASVISNRQAMARRCRRIQWPHAASGPTTSALRGDSAAKNWRRSVRDPWLSPCPCAGEEAMSSLHATQQAAIRCGGPILRPGSRRYSGRARSGTGEKSRSTGKTRSRPGPPLENRQAVASRGRRPCGPAEAASPVEYSRCPLMGGGQATSCRDAPGGGGVAEKSAPP